VHLRRLDRHQWRGRQVRPGPDRRRQAGDRRRVEKRSRTSTGRRRTGLDARDHLNLPNRVTAEGEEVVVHTHAVDTPVRRPRSRRGRVSSRLPGSTKRICRSGRRARGAGSARGRLPEALVGNSSKAWRQRGPCDRAGARREGAQFFRAGWFVDRHHVGTNSRAGAVVRATTTAAPTPGCASNAPDTLGRSTRKPRIFT
jgi:hypothetical protein